MLNLLSAPVCGTTPLHDAVGNNHYQVVELLVRAGGQSRYFEWYSADYIFLAACSQRRKNARTDVGEN